MLPNDQSNESNSQKNENWNVEESQWSFGQEFLSVIKENSLEFSLVGPETEHSDQDNCNNEA